MASKGFIDFQGAGVSFVGLETGQTSVTAGGASLVVAGRSHRGRLLLVNLSTDTNVYVSEATDVTSGDGFPLLPQTYHCWEYTGTLYGIASSGTVTVAVGELK